jgi:hypothetical protein
MWRRSRSGSGIRATDRASLVRGCRSAWYFVIQKRMHLATKIRVGFSTAIRGSWVLGGPVDVGRVKLRGRLTVGSYAVNAVLGARRCAASAVASCPEPRTRPRLTTSSGPTGMGHARAPFGGRTKLSRGTADQLVPLCGARARALAAAFVTTGFAGGNRTAPLGVVDVVMRFSPWL